MIISIIAIMFSFSGSENIEVSHSASRKIYVRNYTSNKKIKRKIPRNFRKNKKSSITKPWNGHFSAKNFRTTQIDQSCLKKIKENLKTSILALPGWHTRALKDLEVKKSAMKLNCYIMNKLEERTKAKKNGDFTLADKIREELFSKGIMIEDQKGKTIWKVQ